MLTSGLCQGDLSFCFWTLAKNRKPLFADRIFLTKPGYICYEECQSEEVVCLVLGAGIAFDVLQWK